MPTIAFEGRHCSGQREPGRLVAKDPDRGNKRFTLTRTHARMSSIFSLQSSTAAVSPFNNSCWMNLSRKRKRGHTREWVSTHRRCNEGSHPSASRRQQVNQSYRCKSACIVFHVGERLRSGLRTSSLTNESAPSAI